MPLIGEFDIKGKTNEYKAYNKPVYYPLSCPKLNLTTNSILIKMIFKIDTGMQYLYTSKKQISKRVSIPSVL